MPSGGKRPGAGRPREWSSEQDALLLKTDTALLPALARRLHKSVMALVARRNRLRAAGRVVAK